MPTNFHFLEENPEYRLFANACIEAERVLTTSPAMAAVGCRKALELAVKWVYSADNTIRTPYRENLQSLIHEPSFKNALDVQTWGKLPYIIKLGNLAVHTNKAITRSDAILSLSSLFEFVQWIDYCYGSDYEEREFDESKIPSEIVLVDESKIKEQEWLIEQKESEIEALRAQIAAITGQLTEDKAKHQEERHFTPRDLSEFMTRKKYIDVELKLLGWKIGDDVLEEVPVTGMPNVSETGTVDYVLYGKDGLPLAIIEAKRTSKDPKVGTQQAKLYADCLERMTGRRPIMFITNGFETYLWDDLTSPQRKVSGLFSKSDLEKLINRRNERRALNEVVIDDKITDRYYQKEAIRAVCESIERGQRKALLVMATGTGKTRTAASLTDVLSRGGYVTNVLFLADRTELVDQAKDSFKNCLPDMSLCNLLSNKEDKNARIVFSTYHTMLNIIDSAKNEEGLPLYTPAHFDLIIIDEAHRSIFNKFKVIFDYFDAIMVGLTATPKMEVDRNTYEFFELENGVPTYAYDYETAVEKDKVLVPYYNIEVTTKFMDQGIIYDQLSVEDKERYEEDFADDEGAIPDHIPAEELNRYIFNQSTIDMVIQDLMTKGIKVADGDRIGKTIIFAQNDDHAQYIVERFNKLYPQYNGTFARRITYRENYVKSLIADFKVKDKEPHIAVSVDMLDTGIDVPEVVNLVFFKSVRSKTKFWQMIGRGTRTCKNLFGDGKDKAHFVIFDYMRNFEFFRQHKEGIEGSDSKSVTELIFSKRVRIIHLLQQSTYSDDAYQQFRKHLVDETVTCIRALNTELVSVRMQLKHVEKYQEISSYTALSDSDIKNLAMYIAPLVFIDEKDDAAKRFDNFIYGLMLAQMEGTSSLKRYKHELISTAQFLLDKRATVPAVKDNLELIKSITTEEFWHDVNILTFEQIRVALRGLISLLKEEGNQQSIIYTNLKDEVLMVKEGAPLEAAYDFEAYRQKVNRFIEENCNHTAIYKLRHNIPLTAADYESLERIFTGELGTIEDYKREFQDTPFGLLVRKIAKLEYDAVMETFSQFINDQSLTQAQIVFVRKVIDYIVQNGYIDQPSELVKPPFDKPQSFIKLFDATNQKQLIDIVTKIKENAVKIVG